MRCRYIVFGGYGINYINMKLGLQSLSRISCDFKRCPSHSDIRFNIIFGRIDCQAFQTVKLSFYDFFDFNTK